MRPQVNHWTVMLYFLLCTVLSQPAETIVMACVPLVSAKLFYLKLTSALSNEMSRRNSARLLAASWMADVCQGSG